MQTGIRAHRLLFAGKRCIGVEYSQNGVLEQVLAGADVIVCCGALESPRLLMLSGIGPIRDLQRLGIDVRINLPGVGQNLHDHTLVPIIYAAKTEVPTPLLGLQALHSQMFWRSDDRLPSPELQPLFFHVPTYLPGMNGPANGYTLAAGHIRPAR